MSRPGSTRILRLALRSPVAAPLTDVQGQGARPDADAGADRSLSAVNLTYHIEPDTTGIDQAIESPRECDCSPSVLRCVHINGEILYLVSESKETSPHTDDCFLFRFYTSQFNFVVAHCTEVIDCGYCGAPQGATRGGVGFIRGTRNEADAIAAFYAAEAELVGRAL